MLTRMGRYVAGTFLSSYIILMSVGIGFYVLTGLLVNIDEFTEEGTRPFGDALGVILDFYGSNLPLYFSQLSGPVIAIAAAFTFGMMLRQNELTAMVAAGVPLQRLLIPVFGCAVGLILLGVADREWLIPELAPRIARTADDVAGTSVGGVYCARDEHNAILSALKFDPAEGLLVRLFIIEPSVEGRPRDLIEADSARYDSAAGVWRLERGRRIAMRAPAASGELGGAAPAEAVETYAFGLTPSDLSLRRNAQWSDLLSLAQMRTLLASPALTSRATLVSSWHVRLTQPLTQLILLMLTVPYFLSRQPENVLACGGRALLLAGTFFVTTFVLQTLIRDEQAAALVAWLPLMVFGPVAAVQVAGIRT